MPLALFGCRRTVVEPDEPRLPFSIWLWLFATFAAGMVFSVSKESTKPARPAVGRKSADNHAQQKWNRATKFFDDQHFGIAGPVTDPAQTELFGKALKPLPAPKNASGRVEAVSCAKRRLPTRKSRLQLLDNRSSAGLRQAPPILITTSALPHR